MDRDPLMFNPWHSIAFLGPVVLLLVVLVVGYLLVRRAVRDGMLDAYRAERQRAAAPPVPPGPPAPGGPPPQG